MTSFNNMDDVIDSRDIIERIAELRDMRETYLSDFESESERAARTDHWNECTPEGEELETLEKLAAECESYADDWEYGVTLVRDSYFTDYAINLVEECGYISKDFPHWIEVDWEATARNVRMDYTNVDFDGVTYWIR